RLASARFILDVHPGALARRLRLVGVDAAYANDLDDETLIERANAARRGLLTQDRGLLRPPKLWLGGPPRRGAPRSPPLVVAGRPDARLGAGWGGSAPPLAPWTRCPACNGLLSPASKADVEPVLQPGTRRTYQEFSRCGGCRRVYWRGAHRKRLEALVESALG